MYKHCNCGCNCNNNCNTNNIYNFNDDLLENNSCSNINSFNIDFYNDDCACGFDEECNGFPENPMLAQSYVPMQTLNKTFTPCAALRMGTIFPELVSPYYPGLSIEQINYIKANNETKEGCNSCQNMM